LDADCHMDSKDYLTFIMNTNSTDICPIYMCDFSCFREDVEL
jgi:hypothetical protein